MMRRNDSRARGHSSYWAFIVHRVSGLALAFFLPLHFLVLSQALQGAAALDRLIKLTDAPLVKLSEWILVTLLALHLMGGVRVLVIEFLPWRGLRKGWIAAGCGIGIAAGLAYALALVG
jgi:fumarate reductase subunit D